MKNTNKAERIRMKRKKGIKRAEVNAFGMKGEAKKKWVRKFSGRFGDVTKFCGGVCCANPRKHFGHKTMQEIKADLDLKDVD